MKRLFPRGPLLLLLLLAPAVLSAPVEVPAEARQEAREKASKRTRGASRQASRRGFRFGQGLGFAVNPLGLMLSSSISYELPLIRKPGILWESTHLTFGVENALTPAFDEFGGFVSV